MTYVRNPRLFIVLLTTQSCMKQLVLHTDVLAANIAATQKQAIKVLYKQFSDPRRLSR